jgi:hypothetical protein
MLLLPILSSDSENKSSWAHYLAIEGATVGEDAFGIPERSSYHIQGNPSDPF